MFGSYQRTTSDPGNYPDMLGHPDVVIAKGRMDAYYDKIDAYGMAVWKEKAKKGQAKAAIPIMDQVLNKDN